ncbi:MAG TPA: MFS transporter [Burkholderiales bacterium]|nr:MFS transporter [Burkholderiales bacterium]
MQVSANTAVETTAVRRRERNAIVRRLLWGRALRAFADGYASILLPVYLVALGFGPLHVGIIATATLLGSGVMTLGIGLQAHRFEYRTLLIAGALLMAATGLSFASVADFWPLLAVAFLGTLNPSSGGISVFLPVEHAAISRFVEDSERTAAFARYSLVGSLVAALGALIAGAPDLIAAQTGLTLKAALQVMFVAYGAFGLAAAILYRTLPTRSHPDDRPVHAPLGASRIMVYKLAALFCIDSFGGGLVADAMLVLWLFNRFELSTAVAGTIFFWSALLAAFSYPVAVRISRRFGLVNTMVFTHLPSNVLLVLVPFMPSLSWAVALLLARSALSQMDVPTRTSYVMAIVPPGERPAAASITSVPRSFTSAAGPVIAGYLLSLSTFGWPLVVAGVLKGAYDILLLYTCRHVKPPEEASLSK